MSTVGLFLKLPRRLRRKTVSPRQYNCRYRVSGQGGWANYVQNDLSWKTILAMPQSLLSFCLGATFDTLPSPSNLKRWHITTEPSCFLCGKEICTAAHILGACKVALSQGRFTFRHDSVLTDLTDTLNAFIANLTARPPKINNGIEFVRQAKRSRQGGQNQLVFSAWHLTGFCSHCRPKRTLCFSSTHHNNYPSP